MAFAAHNLDGLGVDERCWLPDSTGMRPTPVHLYLADGVGVERRAVVEILDQTVRVVVGDGATMHGPLLAVEPGGICYIGGRRYDYQWFEDAWERRKLAPGRQQADAPTLADERHRRPTSMDDSPATATHIVVLASVLGLLLVALAKLEQDSAVKDVVSLLNLLVGAILGWHGRGVRR